MYHEKSHFIILLTSSWNKFVWSRTNNKKTNEERAEQATQRLEKEITLSTEQRNSIYLINLKTAQKNQEIRKNSLLSDEQKKEQVKINNKSKNQKVASILTEEQRKILKAKRKEKKQQEKEDDL